MKINTETYLDANEADKLVLPERCADDFRRNGTPVSLEKNQVLSKAGDIPDSCYYILKGKIVAYEWTRSGSEHDFSESGPGELLFVPAALITHPMILNFKATVPTELIRIPRDVLLRLMEEKPELSSTLLYALSMRFIETIEQYRQRGNCDTSWRVGKFLLSMAERSGIERDGIVLIREKVSQQTMANRLHANRVTVARAIRDMKEAGLIGYHNGYYSICGIDRFKAHMYDLDFILDDE